MTLVWRPGFQFDADASTYIEAVEAADTQALETGVRYAINDFVIDCKNDGIWDAIKACCILAGARTLSGALVPLVGAAPTPYGFLEGDYDRETGLVGDGSTKYLDSNRASNSDPQNSRHMSVYVSTKTGAGPFAGSVSAGPVYTWIGPGNSLSSDIYVLNSTSQVVVARKTTLGFCGLSRTSSTNLFYRIGSSTTAVSSASAATDSTTTQVFRLDRSAEGYPTVYGQSRLAFYSIGESLDLALLDTRVSNLMTAIGAAIP